MVLLNFDTNNVLSSSLSYNIQLFLVNYIFGGSLAQPVCFVGVVFCKIAGILCTCVNIMFLACL